MKRAILALAVNEKNAFEPTHFGQAKKYLIYEWVDNQFVLIRNTENPYFENPTNHINIERGKELIEFLQENNVNILVSKKFGQNIKLANPYFVPVLTNANTADDLLPSLQKQMRWIVEELQTNEGHYKLFNLSKGVLKTPL